MLPSTVMDSMERRLQQAEGLLEETFGAYDSVAPPEGIHRRVSKRQVRALKEYTKLQRLGAIGSEQRMEEALARLRNAKRRITGLKDLPTKRVDPSAAREQRIAEALAEAILRDELTDEDLAPFRLVVAYRITRTLLTLSGRAEPTQTLMQSLPTLEDWEQPCTSLNRYPKKRHHLLGPLALAIPFMDGYCPLPLVDPQGPEAENLRQFIDVLTRAMALDRGSLEAPASGRLGLHNLVENWPSPFELVQYETDLLLSVHNAVSERGRRPTRNQVLVAGLGYTPWEADELLQRAAQVAMRYARNRDVDVDREYQVERLEGIGDRCRQSLDTRGELNAVKQIAIATGINQHDNTNDDDFEFHESLEQEERQRQRERPEKTLG